jgi:hypothetical protein
MTEQRLTPAQYRALEEVEAGRVRWGKRGGSESTVFPPAVRADVVTRLHRKGLVVVGPGTGWKYALTVKGREALAQHWGPLVSAEALIDRLLDTLVWEELPALEGSQEIPYATHEGILRLGDIELRCYQLNTGQRVFDGADLEALFGDRS